MNTVHVFCSSGRFRSVEQMREYIDQTYTDDGDGIDSEFITEVGLDEYEPGCIEAYCSATGQPVPLTELLAGASYADTWVEQVDGTRTADAAICVFPPNEIAHPENCTLEYVGAFEFKVVHPDWFHQILKDMPPKE